MAEHECLRDEVFKRIEKDFQDRNAEIIELRKTVSGIPAELTEIKGMLRESLNNTLRNEKDIKSLDDKFRVHEIDSPVTRETAKQNREHICILFARQWGIVVSLFVLVVGVLVKTKLGG